MYTFYFVVQVVQVGSWVFSTCLHRFWTPSFWNWKVSQTQLPFLAVESAITPKSPGSFYWRAGLRNQDAGAKCVHCYWGITASSSSRWTWLRNTYMYTNPHSHICISIHIYLPVCDWVLIDPLIPLQYHRTYSTLLTSLTCIFFLWHWET